MVLLTCGLDVHLAEARPCHVERFAQQRLGLGVSAEVFEDALARKSEYRRFIIKSFEGSNDVRAVHEVLTRRLRRLLEDREAMARAFQTAYLCATGQEAADEEE